MDYTGGPMGVDADLLVAAQDYQKLERTHIKAGFRDGVEEGKEEVMVEGFHRGFIEGVQSSLRWARLSGRLSALEMFLQTRGQCLSEEVYQVKKKIERVRGGGGGGEVGAESDKSEMLGVLLEQGESSDKLFQFEQHIEYTLNSAENSLLQTEGK